ncbi:Fc.00g090050.m01.CDS01 [Cosmosporella sp. VM-42]
MFMVHGPPSIRTKVSQILILVIVFSLFIHTRRISQSHAKVPRLDQVALGATERPPEEQYLSRLVHEYGLTNQTEWSAWRVKSTEQPADWTSVTDLPTEFHSNYPKIIDVQDPDRQQLRAKRQLEVPVPGSPLPEQIDASDFLFGISSTYERVVAEEYAIVKDWARWLTGGNRYGNGATFVLVLDRATEKQIDELDKSFAKFGIDAYVTTSLSPMSTARRYFEMIRVMKLFSTTLAQNGQNKKWFGLLDEKIFLPNLSYLQDRLFSYNSEAEMYVGLPSERTDWAIGSGYVTTYGGGAIFLTRPAVSRIPSLPCFEKEDSDKAFKGKRWDSLLQDCLVKHTDLTMTVLPSFYSPSDDDENSAVADSYETGIQPLTLHHYEERHRVNPSIAHLVTDVCGEACFLQRYRFRDNWVLVNGYSITEYPEGLKIGDKSSSVTGRTTEKDGLTILGRVKVDEDSIHRKSLTWKGQRNVWRLIDSAVGKNGAVWQAYVKRGAAEDTPSFKRSESEVMDSVIVLIWETAAASGLKHFP